MKKEWKKHSRELAFLAYEDQCSPANPRLPMVDHMQEIIEDAYYGYKNVQDVVNKTPTNN